MIHSSDNWIPVHEPMLGKEELEAVSRCLDPGRFSSNDDVTLFESAFAAATGANEPIAVANGTVALHLAMLACGIGPGDEVVVPALTFVATANAVAYTGATPVFADVDPVSWQMTANSAAKRVTNRTKAILVVHLYGHACDLSDLRQFATARNLFVIEDCAEALGTLILNRQVGLDADIATFSFYKNKTITTGEGGMIITRHKHWREKIILLKGQGVPLTRRYWHEVLGYNYRMTNLSAAVGLAQLGKLARILDRKRRLAFQYKETLADAPISFQPELAGSRSAWWLITATVAEPSARDGLIAHLSSNSIDTRPVFLPVQRFPMYASFDAPTPCADHISARGICLPSSATIRDDQLSRVVSEIRRYLLGS